MCVVSKIIFNRLVKQRTYIETVMTQRHERETVNATGVDPIPA